MASLRRRLTRATGALLVLQVMGTTVGAGAWWRVQQASQLQIQVSVQRREVLTLGRAARELYVHQAHTFIERGPGHLDHLAEGQIAVDAALVQLESHPGPVLLPLEPIRAALVEANRWFAAEGIPAARAGLLDGARATALHAVAEQHANRLQAGVDAAVAALDEAEALEVARIGRDTRLAWVAVVVVLASSLGLGAAVVRRLAQAVLGPVDGLLRAARSQGTPQELRAPTDGDDELAELGRAFNEMVSRVREAEQRRLERERLQALGEIAGAVAHELMNPLAAILAHNPDPAVRGEAEHARRVVSGLLGFARPGEALPAPVRVDEAAAQAADRAVLYADARDVRVRWRGGPPLTVVGSPTAVRQVLDNLVRNAVEASPAGAEVELEGGPGWVEVRDRGPGLPASVRARLYEPFATGRPDGTGLGLAVSQRVARALGGRLEHQDRPGGGTIARWEVGGG